MLRILALSLACLLLISNGAAQHDAAFAADAGTAPWLAATAAETTRGTTPAQKLSVTLNGITFDSNYDNGSLGGVSALSQNSFSCSLHVEQSAEGLGPRSYWFRFKMEGVAGRTITLFITHSESPRPWYRINDGEWRQTTSSQAPNTSQLNFTFGPGENLAEVAFYEPWGYQETLDRVQAMVAASPHASLETIGLPVNGFDMHMVTVTDPSVPDDDKHRIWVHSRAHAGEVTSTHVMFGWLRQVTADTPMGRHLRRHCIFNIVPLLNVDGVEAGHTRWDTDGFDPERQWCAPITRQGVLNLKAKVDQFMAGGNPIEVALNLHSTQGNWTDTFFFKHLSPSVTSNFEIIQQDYIDAFDNATPLFDNLSAQSSQLNACRFIESYFWNNWGEAVMAMTHEGHFRRRITDNDWITGDDYEELGRAQAVALIEYLGLPQPPEVAVFRTF